MIDHIVVAVPDLADARAWISREWGTTPSSGGRHPKHGTHNMLVRAGPRAYIEILATDPQVAAEDRSERGRMIAAVLAPTVFEILLATHSAATLLGQLPVGMQVRDDAPGERHNDDGSVVKWHRVRLALAGGGALPDFIEWRSEHPALALPTGVQIQQCVISRPDGVQANAALNSLGVNDATLKISEGHEQIDVRLSAPEGVVTI